MGIDAISALFEHGYQQKRSTCKDLHNGLLIAMTIEL
jgi:hypothetical protein